MLTARGDVTDRVVGLELGATTICRSPSSARAGRTAADHPAPRRHAPAGPANSAAPLSSTACRIDVARRTVHRQGEAVELTGTEFELLLLLAREPNKGVQRDQILNRLRGRDAELYTRASTSGQPAAPQAAAAAVHQRRCAMPATPLPELCVTRKGPPRSPAAAGRHWRHAWPFRCTGAWWRCSCCWRWAPRWSSWPARASCSRPAGANWCAAGQRLHRPPGGRDRQPA